MSLHQRVVRYWSVAVSGEARGPVAGLLRAFLTPLAWGYGLGVKLRNLCYDRQFWMFKTVRLPVAVVSVGNIAVGGTGKTPFVALLAERLGGMGRKPCILSRGYGRGSEASHNDEYLMLRELLPDVPHLVGTERLLTGIHAILQFRSDVLILDDGFQHRKLARDLDIVLVDALQPLGLGHLLPRGRLRELVSGFGRAHLICLTHSDLVEPEALKKVRRRVRRLAPGVPILEAKHQPRALRPVLPDGEEQPVGALAGKRVAAFCALGSPESFIEEVRLLGAEVVHQALFPDHHRFTVSEFQRLCADAGDAGAELLLCTHKDAVKLPDDLSPPLPVLALEMELVILRGEEHLQEALSALPVKVGPMRLRYQGEEDSAEP